jgi:hypothetical protein
VGPGRKRRSIATNAAECDVHFQGVGMRSRLLGQVGVLIVLGLGGLGLAACSSGSSAAKATTTTSAVATTTAATSTTTTVPPTTTTTTAPPPTTAPPTTAAPVGCHPLSDEGGCYRAGEYCRDATRGVSGVATNGEAIVCETNDGLRWEPM